jgi:hypothetical protein
VPRRGRAVTRCDTGPSKGDSAAEVLAIHTADRGETAALRGLARRRAVDGDSARGEARRAADRRVDKHALVLFEVAELTKYMS